MTSCSDASFHCVITVISHPFSILSYHYHIPLRSSFPTPCALAMSLVSLIVLPSVSGSSLLSKIPMCPEVHSGPCAPGPARCLVRCAIPIFPSPRGASNDSVVSLFAYTYTCRRIYIVRSPPVVYPIRPSVHTYIQRGAGLGLVYPLYPLAYLCGLGPEARGEWVVTRGCRLVWVSSTMSACDAVYRILTCVWLCGHRNTSCVTSVCN